MLQDYRNYIMNIRNGLIQCGVDVSISPLTSYKDLFYEADKLSQILWFYSIMGISGSPLALDDFFIDISGYYKEKMRQIYYKEFQDYYDSYKHISKLAYLAGDNGSNTEIIEDDEFDLFSSEESVDVSELIEEKEPENNVVGSIEEVHGTFIDEDDFYKNIDKVLGTGYIPVQISVDLMVQGSANTEVHGVFIDELAYKDADEGDIHGIFLDEIEETGYNSYNGDIHGTILDDVVSDGLTEYEEDTYDDIHYSDDEEEYYSDEDEEVYDDIHYSDDDEDEYYSEEDEEVYDDIHYSDDEDEEYYSDEEEEPYDDIHYSDDEDEYYSEDEEEPYDDIHYADDDDEYVEPQQINSVVKPNTGTVSTKVNNPVGDMSDIIQNGVNALLTKGKRFILTESRKLRDGDEK